MDPWKGFMRFKAAPKQSKVKKGEYRVISQLEPEDANDESRLPTNPRK
jgi:hypothetical protein